MYGKELADFVPENREGVASVDEVLRFFSSVMRGEVDKDPALSNRVSAAKELMRSYEAADRGQAEAIERIDQLIEAIGREAGADGAAEDCENRG